MLLEAEPASASAPAAEADPLEALGMGGFAPRPAALRALRLAAWLACACVAAPPWALCAAVEALCSADGRWLRAKMVAWRFVGPVWHDALVLAARAAPASYGRACYCFAPARAAGKVALTIDDAPGRDPAALEELLDVLAAHGARATFFITSDYAECLVDDDATAGLDAAARAAWARAVARALRRLVREGHELGNHMPADRPYAALCARDEPAFCAALARTQRVLAAIVADAASPPADAREPPVAPAVAARALGRWYRPPSAVLSARMASLLRAAAYRIALCDAYSADPWVDGGGAPSASACAFHADWLAGAMRAGSIAVLHAPERRARRQTLGALRALLPRLRARGLEPVTLSELARQVLEEGPSLGAAEEAS